MQLTVWAKVQNGENMWKFQPEQVLRTKKILCNRKNDNSNMIGNVVNLKMKLKK